MNISKSAFVVYLADLVRAGATFLGIVYLTGVLGSSVLGIYFLFEAVLALLNRIADFGISTALEKRISEGQEASRILSSALLVESGFVGVISIAILLASDPLASYLGADLAVYLVLALATRQFAEMGLHALQGELRVAKMAPVRASKPVVWATVSAVLASKGYGVHSVVIGLIAGYGVMIAWGAIRMDTRPGLPSVEHARSLLDYSRYEFISSISGYAYNWTDVLVLGFFVPQSLVAAYEIAWRVTEVVILPSKAIATTIFPAISKWDAEQLQRRIESLFPEAVTGSLLLVVPAFFGILLYSREILTFVFDPEYAGAWIVLILLAGEKIVAAVQLVAGRSLGALDRPDLVARATTTGFVANVVLNVVLVREYGIEGAAVATAIASLLTAGLYYLSLRDLLTLRFETTELGWIVVAGVAMALSLFGLDRFVTVDSRTTLVAVVGVGVVLYGGYLLVHPRLRSQLTGRVSRILE